MGLLSWLFGRSRPQSSPNSSNVSPHTYDETDDDEEDYIPAWDYYDVPFGKEYRERGMVGLTGAMDISIAGTSFRHAECADFIKEAVRIIQRRSPPPRIELRRQPDLKGHPNAIMVLGALQDGRSLHIGYVPSEAASQIAENWVPDMPIAAELRRIGIHRTDDAVFFAMNVLVPDAATRKKFKIPN